MFTCLFRLLDANIFLLCMFYKQSSRLIFVYLFDIHIYVPINHFNHNESKIPFAYAVQKYLINRIEVYCATVFTCTLQPQKKKKTIYRCKNLYPSTCMYIDFQVLQYLFIVTMVHKKAHKLIYCTSFSYGAGIVVSNIHLM